MINLTKNQNQLPGNQTQNTATPTTPVNLTTQKTAPKAKTMGIFSLTSRLTPKAEFQFVGSSTQAEVCARDYQSWCRKGKAPKSLQAEYDKACKMANLTPGETVNPAALFHFEILEVCNTVGELEAAKERFGIVRKAPQRTDSTTTAPRVGRSDEEIAKLFSQIQTERELSGILAPKAVSILDRALELAGKPVVATVPAVEAAHESAVAGVSPFADDPTPADVLIAALSTPATEVVVHVLPDEEPAKPATEPKGLKLDGATPAGKPKHKKK